MLPDTSCKYHTLYFLCLNSCEQEVPARRRSLVAVPAFSERLTPGRESCTQGCKQSKNRWKLISTTSRGLQASGMFPLFWMSPFQHASNFIRYTLYFQKRACLSTVKGTIKAIFWVLPLILKNQMIYERMMLWP